MISRKIWMTEKCCNFHALHTLVVRWCKMFVDLDNFYLWHPVRYIRYNIEYIWLCSIGRRGSTFLNVHSRVFSHFLDARLLIQHVCTMLKKLSKCEVKAWLCCNLIILQSLWFYVKSNVDEFKRSKNVIFGNFRGSEFWF